MPLPGGDEIIKTAWIAWKASSGPLLGATMVNYEYLQSNHVISLSFWFPEPFKTRVDRVASQIHARHGAVKRV